MNKKKTKKNWAEEHYADKKVPIIFPEWEVMFQREGAKTVQIYFQMSESFSVKRFWLAYFESRFSC